MARAVAVRLDALGDVGPLWRAFLGDVERRLGAREHELDAKVGNWRVLLERFAEDNAPVHLRRDPEASALLRRAQSAGTRIGVFTDAPLELARVALEHLGAARRVEVVGTLEQVRATLGDDADVVQSRAELARLE